MHIPYTDKQETMPRKSPEEQLDNQGDLPYYGYYRRNPAKRTGEFLLFS